MDRKKRYTSIGRKIITDISICMLFFVIFFSLYIYRFMQTNAMKRYEYQTQIATEVSGTNIDHYITSMITATKSVYINHSLMGFLKYHHSQEEVADNELRIIEYFKSVYYASSAATQIYLVMPEENFSILYEPNLLKIYNGVVSPDVTIPQMDSFRDVYVESTHIKNDYGHNIPDIDKYPADETVFTIWLPIADLPVEQKPFAYVAIDLPTSFIMENCKAVYSEDETIYVLDAQNQIIASSDVKSQMQDFVKCYPWYHKSGFSYAFSRIKGLILTETKINSPYFDWYIVKVATTKSVYALTTGQMISILLIFAILVSVLLLVISSRIMKYTRSLRRITCFMEKERARKNWDKPRKISDYITYDKQDEISSLINSFQKLMDSLKEHAIQKYELKLAYTQSELRTMQAQINPHFIYNVIQCFATNALKNKDLKQYQLISSFGQMLHYAMVLEPVLVYVDQEIEYTRRYIELQQMRFEQHLIVTYKIGPDSGDFKIPKMSIQPLIENSITHGNLMKSAGGVINLEVFAQTEYLHLLVADNGVPVTLEITEKVYAKIEEIRMKLLYQDSSSDKKQTEALSFSTREDENHNHFIGIENVYSRFLLSFGYCEFILTANELGGTTVEFIVPLQARPIGEESNESIDSR
ncbi:histidine kinase [Blautia liquoris]|uniref:Histidine kinase n=1 Tax=Blautia liquoris TaxID=2779518 RepID=A0A7M2REP0_9FIRM|nr:histidine kinase [Blautia liquoris]QOV18805.1 histidine kinase [Blautia liquoris]